MLEIEIQLCIYLFITVVRYVFGGFMRHKALFVLK